MYIKVLSESEKAQLKQRARRIKELQEQGICFGCYNFETDEIFPSEEEITCTFHYSLA